MRRFLLGALATLTSPFKAQAETKATHPNYDTRDESMPAEEIIRQYGEEPLYKSIGPVAAALARRSLFVSTDPGAPAGKLRLRTDVDNQGNMWTYAYTSAAELSKAFPGGVNHIELAFPIFFNIVADDQRFRGIYLVRPEQSPTSCWG
jgi:hypothetical protein